MQLGYHTRKEQSIRAVSSFSTKRGKGLELVNKVPNPNFHIVACSNLIYNVCIS